MALESKYRLDQFSGVFDLRNSEGKPYLLIGGQAVNFWAERYLKDDPNLQNLQPFTSEDIDFKGNRDDVELIARQLKLQPVFPHPREMTALAGAIPFRIGSLGSNIEVVRTIPGVPLRAEEAAIEIEWNGKQLRLLDPVSLFASKLELFVTVPQSNRQDARHLGILVRCVRCFLGELLNEVHQGSVPSRDWLNITGYFLKISSTKAAVRTASELGLSWQDALPWESVGKSADPKIRRFHANSGPK